MGHILIVDDNAASRAYLEALLEGHGYPAETARHGAEAWGMAQREVPDLVISDLLMPVMDGYSLLRRWKSSPHLAHIPFIVYTATYTQDEDEQLALDLGADAFILKPAEPEALLARLRAVCEHVRDKGSRRPEQRSEGEEQDVLRSYSQTLVRKLEEKTWQLEEANRALRADVAHREAVERSLRESELRFRQLAENISEVFWLSDPEKHQILYVSPAYETIWGRSCESLYRNPSGWLEAIHSDDRVRISTAIRRQRTDRGYDETYRIVRPDGSLRWIRDRAFPVSDDTGKIYRVVGIADDFTEEKETEARFLRAQRLESIGTLAGGIAHDLNNVLSPIMMGTDLLSQYDLPPRVHSLIGNIGRSARRGTELVKQVLSFARGVEGARVGVHLDYIVREIESIVTNTLPKNIRFSSTASANLWLVVADPTQLNQILLNLCVNARDAMPEGGALRVSTRNSVVDAVYAATHKDAKAGRYVVLEVADEGSGMPPEVLGRVFEPFFTTKEVGQGTGLGLSTVAGIVRSHCGFIDLRSEVGKGTTFQIFLPARDEPVPPEAEPSEKDPLPLGRGECVLVVDDEAAIREVTREILEAFGYAALTASSGFQALELFERHRAEIALVLTDRMMPGMEGPALLRALRAIDPSVRVILTSGLAAQAPGAHAAPFLAKPYNAKELLRAVRAALSAAD